MFTLYERIRSNRQIFFHGRKQSCSASSYQHANSTKSRHIMITWDVLDMMYPRSANFWTATYDESDMLMNWWVQCSSTRVREEVLRDVMWCYMLLLLHCAICSYLSSVCNLFGPAGHDTCLTTLWQLDFRRNEQNRVFSKKYQNISYTLPRAL